MHRDGNLAQFQHQHDFSSQHTQGEKRTFYVLLLTVVTMVIEIIAGTLYGSMALLADGWHMATHVAAFLLTIFAYWYARKHADNPRYAFGTGKVNVLGGFASAVALAVVALVMMIESVVRLIEPHTIVFNQAIMIAMVGLVVNLASAALLKDDHHHSHASDHHHDHNLRAAYLHVLADALTSLLAIVALILGKYLGWHWLDSLMGIVGAVIILKWSAGLIKQTGPTLLDESIDQHYRQKIRQVIENNADNRVVDLHIWKISATHYAGIISLVTHYPQSPEYYKHLLQDFSQLSHLTVEVNRCPAAASQGNE